MIPRILLELVEKRLSDQKAIILLGPRQVGKTTLLKHLVTKLNQDHLWWNGDETDIRQMLEEPTSTMLKSLIGSHNLVIIDEAQRIANIGLCIKLIYDNLPDVKVIATGSSAFELANQINEPLTGRKWEYNMFPISFEEMVNHTDLLSEKRLLEHRLIFGYYPEILNQPGNERPILNQLSDSYLFKDILVWERVQKPDRLEALVQALALQLGNEVSYLELSGLSGLDKETVERYILLLERAFIVFRLRSFHRNHRTELKKSRKIYFYDNGLRNSIINNFNPIDLRSDKGALWENFLVTERMKRLHYNQIFVNRYFWRTHEKQEIDYIEDRNGILYGYEFKWNPNSKEKFPKTFAKVYPDSQLNLITSANFSNFVM